MIIDRRIAITALLSVAAHVAAARALGHLPRRADTLQRRVISIRVVAPPPVEPPPEPPVEPPKPAEPQPPRPVPHERPRVRHAPTPDTPPPVPQEVPPPPPNNLATSDNANAPPIFGINMESTSQAGHGPALPVGNGPVGPRRDSPTAEARKAAAPVVPSYEATVMPLPQGRCVGKYTPEALEAAVEGAVVLSVVVGENGRARDIKVVSGLGHGLDEAAIAALKECRFSPGEKDGKPVPVSIREFKVRFVLPGGD